MPTGRAVPLLVAAAEKPCSFIVTVPWCAGAGRVQEKLTWTWSRATAALMLSWKRSKSCRESKRKSVCVTQCSRSSIELKFCQSSSASKAVRSPSKRGVSKRWKAEMLQKCLGCLCYDIYLLSVWPEAQILLPTTKYVLVCCQTRSGTLFTAGKLLLIFHCFKAGPAKQQAVGRVVC